LNKNALGTDPTDLIGVGCYKNKILNWV